ncbi:MAG: hypothetical protein EOP88_09615 [Verrucomicrobiaceae bacterium]|nr:MAG: hypothetical protein EOP88_09615 [Verrucomicrobiaceae bacterium]
MRLAPIIANVSRSGRILFRISVVVLIGVICYNQFKKDEVPITRSIGLKADYDEVRDWFNTQTVRNLVYENKNADPQFYAGIVGKIENCEWVKTMKLQKQEPAGSSERFVFGVTDYTEENLRGSVSFRHSGNEFQCDVYDHTDFVLVVLSAWY